MSIDPLTKQHFDSSMGWIRFVAAALDSDNDREVAEQMVRELNGLNIQLANRFGFEIRTGRVHKVQNMPLRD